ncbi:MAG: mannose-6-phosphate isomerase, partial [Bacteroidaceae bacterium]|nr:mannose-6-phosphate isomerase [Bacteroidaceae bacterium]
MELEFIRFNPLLKQTLWGGNRLASFKHIDTSLECVGESWEVSDVKGSESIVAEGTYKGMNLTELVRTLKGRLVG